MSALATPLIVHKSNTSVCKHLCVLAELEQKHNARYSLGIEYKLTVHDGEHLLAQDREKVL